MADPKPIALTSVTAASYTGPDPQPMVVVSATGTGVVTPVTRQAAIANQPAATLPADFAGVQTQLQSITTKVNAILAALRNAGVINP